MQKEPSSKLVLERRIAGLLARRNDYRGALEIAERIARENPKSVDCRELLAGLLADSGDPSNATRAQQMYAALVKEFPDNATYRQNLGRVNYLRADFAAALIALTEALRLNPSSVPTRRLLVQTAFAMGSYDRVLRSADEVLTLNPRDSEIRLTRAIALNRLGINGQARAELMRLVADTPDYVPAQLELALLDLAANRIDRAEAVFRRYYRPGLDDLRPLDGLGQVLVRRGKIDEAIRLLEKERGVSPYPSRIDSILGDVAQRVNRPKVAVAAFQRMVEATNSAFAWTRLSGAQLANGDAVAALASSRRAVEIDPRDAATQSALAAAAFAADDIRTSVTALTAALQIKPNDPGVQNNLAFGLAEQGENLVEAARLADSAVRAQPSNLLFADTQAWVALKRGNREAAVQSLESLVKKLPDNGTIRYHRAAALAAIGEDKLARAEFEQAIALGLAPRDRATATKFVVAAK
jgi:Flp pilus assembly protein TadD